MGPCHRETGIYEGQRIIIQQKPTNKLSQATTLNLRSYLKLFIHKRGYLELCMHKYINIVDTHIDRRVSIEFKEKFSHKTHGRCGV